MSKKRVQLLRNYVYGTNRIDKINNGKLLVEEYGFFPQTSNGGDHFHWKEMTIKFDFWPTKEKMYTVETKEDGSVRNKSYYCAASIAKALEKYETLLFKEE